MSSSSSNVDYLSALLTVAASVLAVLFSVALGWLFMWKFFLSRSDIIN